MIDTGTVTSIAAFGSSNIDNGNLYALTDQLLRAPLPSTDLGYQQAHTNGDVFVQYAAEQLGFDGFENYAISSARTVGSYTLGRYLVENQAIQLIRWQSDLNLLRYEFNLDAQIDRYLAAHEGEDLSGALTVIQMGLNDYLSFTPFTVEEDIFEIYIMMRVVTDEIMENTRQLLDAGVGTVVLNTISDTDLLPLGAEIPEGANELYDWVIGLHNKTLYQIAETLSAEGHQVLVVDVNALLEAVNDDLSAFGFIAPLDVYSVHYDAELGYTVQDTGYDADQVAFYDHIHASTAYHAVAGAFQARALTSDVALLGDAGEAFTGAETADLVLSGAGADTVALAGGDDVAITGHGDDTIDGGTGRDLLNGGSGNDTVTGGDGADVLAGSDGDDVLYGGAEQDALIGGLGSDRIYGEDGDDQILYRQESLIGGEGGSTDVIDGGDGYDVLYLAVGDAMRTAHEQDGVLDTDGLVADLGLQLTSIEEIVLVGSRADLATISSDALIAEADLWGMI